MARRRAGCRSHCPVSFALDVFGDRWTLLVIRDIMLRGKETYGDFLDSEEKIATNILADRLAWLEKQDIIVKSRDPRNRRRCIRRLTGKGIDLLPILLEIVAWSVKYDPETATPPAFAKRLLADRDGLKREVLSALRPSPASKSMQDRAKTRPGKGGQGL